MQNKLRDVVTQDVENTEVLNVFFTSVFTSRTDLQESEVSENKAKGWSKVYPWWKRIRSGNIYANWTYVSPWALMRCTYKY